MSETRSQKNEVAISTGVCLLGGFRTGEEVVVCLPGGRRLEAHFSDQAQLTAEVWRSMTIFSTEEDYGRVVCAIVERARGTVYEVRESSKTDPDTGVRDTIFTLVL
jgi:hypothetical protein